MIIYANETHDEERAFYGINDAKIINCTFEGIADGESALKETYNIDVENCNFLLRYLFWHTTKATINQIKMTETCRVALWYDKDIQIRNSELGGVKALRECNNVTISDCNINSIEFGWFCHNIKIQNCKLISEYPFLHSSEMEFDKLHMAAKYSFQYTENIIFRNCELNTKDAFWHSKNITVYDSVIKGEYLGWYSENLHLVRCKIIGTQPLCYAKGLILQNCEMIDCDLSFEKSDVKATINGEITSIKNPISGEIIADCIGEVIIENDCDCNIVTKLANCCCL